MKQDTKELVFGQLLPPIAAAIIGLLLAFWLSTAIAAEPVQLARMTPVVAGGGAAAKTEYTVYITDNTTDFNSYTYASVTKYTGAEDTAIRQGNSSLNYGATVELNLNLGTGANINALIKFSGLSNIPSTATVKSVEFGIRNSGNGGEITWTLRRLLVDWYEGTQDAGDSGNDTPDSACWRQWRDYTTEVWTTAGGLSDGNDRSATTTGTIVTDGAASWKTVTAAQMVTDIQGMVDGTYGNYGWHFQGSGTDNWCNFISSEGTNGSRPYLKVVYEN